MNVAPLSGSLMIASILGFLISVMWVFKFSPTWGFTFALISTILFIATMISVTKGPVEDELSLDRRAVRIEIPGSGKKHKK